MTVSTSDSQIMIGTAALLEPAEAQQQHWAKAHVDENPALRWIVAKYVEGGRANRNNHFWSPQDLAATASTVENTPINMLHKNHYVVGTVTNARYMDEDHNLSMAQEIDPFNTGGNNPFIEVVGPLWRYYFANEVATAEQAYAEGRLFVSMECVAQEARWHTPEGESKSFPYRGPNDASYGEWQSKDNVMQFVEPHFLGTALIVPPVKPGWEGAEVRHVQAMVDRNEAQAAQIYESIAELAPHLDASDWEETMLRVLLNHKSVEVV